MDKNANASDKNKTNNPDKQNSGADGIIQLITLENRL